MPTSRRPGSLYAVWKENNEYSGEPKPNLIVPPTSDFFKHCTNDISHSDKGLSGFSRLPFLKRVHSSHVLLPLNRSESHPITRRRLHKKTDKPRSSTFNDKCSDTTSYLKRIDLLMHDWSWYLGARGTGESG
jgi:hypothetical protein